MLNYLSLLGWATSDSQQLFDPAHQFKELVEKFELERCQKSPAVFDMEKLKWMNGVYIRKFSSQELLDRCWPFLVEANLVSDSTDATTKEYVRQALMLEHEKMVTLTESPGLVDFFLKENVQFDPESVEKVFKKPEVTSVLEGIIKETEKLETLTADNTEKMCRDYAANNTLKNGQVFHPVRVAVSGRTKGPSLFHMLEVMGKTRVLQRIKAALPMTKVSI